jgi:hypothetical protein
MNLDDVGARRRRERDPVINAAATINADDLPRTIGRCGAHTGADGRLPDTDGYGHG